jgi:MtN3 and saliva related transmembrane protein
MSWISIIGFVAGALNTFCFLPQVIKIWKTKETKDLSLLMYIALTVGTVLWLTYGLVLNQPPIWVANGVALTLTVSILYLKIKHV